MKRTLHLFGSANCAFTAQDQIRRLAEDLTGLVGVAFERRFSQVQNMRIGALVPVADHAFLLWPLALYRTGVTGDGRLHGAKICAGSSGYPGSEGAGGYVRCAGGACCR